jgi:hypothetical protein
MQATKKITLLAACLSLLLLSSCGDSSVGGGVGEYKTVMLTASAATVRLESDVLSANNCSTTPPTGGTYTTDNVDVKLTSAVYPGFTGITSNVMIDSITISYTPVNAATPALADVYVSSMGTVLTPGSSVTIPVPVAKDILKYSLVTEKNLQLCSANMFEYYVTISFEGLELNSGTRSKAVTSLNIAFADRAGTT